MYRSGYACGCFSSRKSNISLNLHFRASGRSYLASLHWFRATFAKAGVRCGRYTSRPELDGTGLRGSGSGLPLGVCATNKGAAVCDLSYLSGFYLCL
jgi:hypothetical protein